MQRRVFRAMGTDVELLVDAEHAGAELDAAEHEFARLEALLSRFREDSELSRLNRAGSLDVSTDTARVIELSLHARANTGGRFDPTVHDAVAAAGYDRSFEELPHNGEGPVCPARCGGVVRVDGCHVELEPGFRLDLGGIGKGYAAERAAELLALAGGPCLVNAGGDIAVRGGDWQIGVDENVTLALSAGGVATSGRDRRRWRRDGRELHHLIDPATGTPAETDLLRVTAVADDATQAEVAAKWLFLLGEDEAANMGVPCVLVRADGSIRLAGGLG
jgi:thiamine biosynthesis lipoprotein